MRGRAEGMLILSLEQLVQQANQIGWPMREVVGIKDRAKSQ